MNKLILFILLLTVHCFAYSQERSTVVVTCATGSLGEVIAETLAPDYNLILTGRNMSKLNSLQQKLKEQNNGQYEIFSLDFTNSNAIDEFKRFLIQRDEAIHGLVLIPPRSTLLKNLFQEEREWLQLFQMMFTGPVEVLKSTLPYLSDHGKIAIISGITSVQFIPEYGPSCIIRRMWSTYSKALSHLLGPKGIHVNVLSPGVVMTQLHEDRIRNKAKENGATYTEQLAKDVSQIPLRRHSTPLEIAHTIRFLLSKDSNFITGVNLVIDGGESVSY